MEAELFVYMTNTKFKSKMFNFWTIQSVNRVIQPKSNTKELDAQKVIHVIESCKAATQID